MLFLDGGAGAGAARAQVAADLDAGTFAVTAVRGADFAGAIRWRLARGGVPGAWVAVDPYVLGAPVSIAAYTPAPAEGDVLEVEADTTTAASRVLALPPIAPTVTVALMRGATPAETIEQGETVGIPGSGADVEIVATIAAAGRPALTSGDLTLGLTMDGESVGLTYLASSLGHTLRGTASWAHTSGAGFALSDPAGVIAAEPAEPPPPDPVAAVLTQMSVISHGQANVGATTAVNVPLGYAPQPGDVAVLAVVGYNAGIGASPDVSVTTPGTMFTVQTHRSAGRRDVPSTASYWTTLVVLTFGETMTGSVAELRVNANLTLEQVAIVGAAYRPSEALALAPVTDRLSASVVAASSSLAVTLGGGDTLAVAALGIAQSGLVVTGATPLVTRDARPDSASIFPLTFATYQASVGQVERPVTVTATEELGGANESLMLIAVRLAGVNSQRPETPDAYTPDQLRTVLNAATPGQVIKLSGGAWGTTNLTGYSFAAPGVTIQAADPSNPPVFYRLELRNCAGFTIRTSRGQRATGVTTTYALFDFDDCSRIVVEDCYFQGKDELKSFDGAPPVLATVDMPIYVEGGSDITIRDNEMFYSERGMTLSNIDGFVVERNKIHDYVEDGISCAFCQNGAIRDNVIYNPRRVPGGHPDMIQVQTPSNITIERNWCVQGTRTTTQGIFTGLRDDGVFSAGGPPDLIVRNNVVSGNQVNMLRLAQQLRASTVERNTVIRGAIPNTFTEIHANVQGASIIADNWSEGLTGSGGTRTGNVTFDPLAFTWPAYPTKAFIASIQPAGVGAELSLLPDPPWS
jgi:hypothetical protein